VKHTVATAWIAGAGVAGLALSAAMWQFGYSPKFDAISESTEQVEALEAQAAQIEIDHLALAKEQESLPQKKAALDLLHKSFPTSLELNKFTMRLSDLVTASGAQVEEVSLPPNAVPVGEAVPLPDWPDGSPAPTIAAAPPGMYGYKLKVEVTGTLDQAKKFLMSVQEQESRTVLVNRLSWTNDSTDSTDQSAATFTIEGFVYALVPVDQLPPSEEQ
jgi:Tfp pilus assembly protein PilO